MNNRILLLVGPTGSGKSELAVSLAKALKGEIVSADSMLVYRGMNVGTAKPTLKERKRIKHHVMDVVNPRQRFSVNQYRKLALTAMREIIKKKRLPIVVGGSGLYLQSLIDGLAPQSKKTQAIRKKLEQELVQKGLTALYDRLKEIDLDRAREILPGDARRIIRSLEIYEAFHVQPSVWRKTRVGLKELGFSWLMFGLGRDRNELYQRINERVDCMMERGFLNEVKRLSKKGLSRTARQAIGYCELLNFLKKRISLEEAVEITKQRSRNLAKKQLIWFRKEKRIHWIFLRPNSSLDKVKKTILKIWKEKACQKK